MEATINVPFKLLAQDSRNTLGVPFCFIDHPVVDGSYYGPVNKSKQILRTRLSEQMSRHCEPSRIRPHVPSAPRTVPCS